MNVASILARQIDPGMHLWVWTSDPARPYAGPRITKVEVTRHAVTIHTINGGRCVRHPDEAVSVVTEHPNPLGDLVFAADSAFTDPSYPG